MPENSIDHIDFEDLNKRSISPHIITHLYTADPSAHVFDGKLYIYPSHDIDAGDAFDDLGSHFAMEDYHVFSMDTFKEYRNVMYDYHIKGLDLMVNEPRAAKESIAKSIMMLDQMNRRRPNSYILRVFFDTKSDEILDIFSGGPNVPVTNLISTLTKIAPNHSDKWRNISF